MGALGTPWVCFLSFLSLKCGEESESKYINKQANVESQIVIR